jgi:cytochrome c6
MGLRSLAAVLMVGLAMAPTAAAGDSELGKKIFAQRCASCHGPDGKGNAQMAEKLKVKIPDLATSAGKSDAELLKLLSEGKKPMPPFGKMLSKDQLDAVLAHAKQLAKGNK